MRPIAALLLILHVSLASELRGCAQLSSAVQSAAGRSYLIVEPNSDVTVTGARDCPLDAPLDFIVGLNATLGLYESVLDMRSLTCGNATQLLVPQYVPPQGWPTLLLLGVGRALPVANEGVGEGETKFRTTDAPLHVWYIFQWG